LAAKACQRQSSYTVPGFHAVISKGIDRHRNFHGALGRRAVKKLPLHNCDSVAPRGSESCQRAFE